MTARSLSCGFGLGGWSGTSAGGGLGGKAGTMGAAFDAHPAWSRGVCWDESLCNYFFFFF